LTQGLDIDDELWSRWRNEAYRRFVEDIEIGYVDPDIVPLIKLIFSKRSIFSISSCSGRVVAVDTTYPWVREDASIIFKKHSPLTLNELISIINTPIRYRCWIIVSGPILHIVAKSLESATKVLNLARSCGFKHSGIISLRRDGIVLELISGTWTSFLVKELDTVLIDLKHAEKLLKTVNEILEEGKRRLQRLEDALKHADL